MELVKKNIGESIEAICADEGYDLDWLAEDISQLCLSDLEDYKTGKQKPDEAVLAAIAKKLKVTVPELKDYSLYSAKKQKKSA